jgi:dihydroorotate dehydrogenase
MFRVKEEEAIINRMGFNNKGVDNLVENLKARRSNILVGVNIGKNKDTPLDEGKNDYLMCMEKVYPHAAYITVNISSPNTPGLRSLQYGELLNELLSELKVKQRVLTEAHGRYVPLALKIAPDLSEKEIDSIAVSLLENKFDAVIATNTTLDRQGISGLQHAEENGGLSGCPLFHSSTAVIVKLHSKLQKRIPIIGVGGINNANDAQMKFEAGADLVQIYTGFIYQGPVLIKQIIANQSA